MPATTIEKILARTAGRDSVRPGDIVVCRPDIVLQLDLPLTVDPVEYRGLEYQTGVSFSVFALKGRQELARGGRYSAGYPDDGASEPATGFTVYMDAVLAASEATPQQPRLYMPLGIAWREAAAWQAKGYAVVRAVAAAAEARSEAKRLNCSLALVDGDAVPL